MASAVSWVVVVGLIGGVAVAVQASLAGIISEQLGVIENAFIVFGGGFLTALILLLINQGGRIKAHSLADFADGQGIELQHAENAVLQATDSLAAFAQPFFECLVEELE